jgi:hypothetical protein
MAMYIAKPTRVGNSATRINGQTRQRIRTPARILRTNSPALTVITKPASGELRRLKISRSRALLVLVEATVAAEALAEGAVAAVEAAVEEAAVAAGGDKNKQVVQLLR